MENWEFIKQYESIIRELTDVTEGTLDALRKQANDEIRSLLTPVKNEDGCPFCGSKVVAHEFSLQNPYHETTKKGFRCTGNKNKKCEVIFLGGFYGLTVEQFNTRYPQDRDWETT